MVQLRSHLENSGSCKGIGNGLNLKKHKNKYE